MVNSSEHVREHERRRLFQGICLALIPTGMAFALVRMCWCS
jgi:hypothetical protein